jgi:hypothetical protein
MRADMLYNFCPHRCFAPPSPGGPAAEGPLQNWFATVRALVVGRPPKFRKCANSMRHRGWDGSASDAASSLRTNYLPWEF